MYSNYDFIYNFRFRLNNNIYHGKIRSFEEFLRDNGFVVSVCRHGFKNKMYYDLSFNTDKSEVYPNEDRIASVLDISSSDVHFIHIDCRLESDTYSVYWIEEDLIDKIYLDDGKLVFEKFNMFTSTGCVNIRTVESRLEVLTGMHTRIEHHDDLLLVFNNSNVNSNTYAKALNIPSDSVTDVSTCELSDDCENRMPIIIDLIKARSLNREG